MARKKANNGQVYSESTRKITLRDGGDVADSPPSPLFFVQKNVDIQKYVRYNKKHKQYKKKRKGKKMENNRKKAQNLEKVASICDVARKGLDVASVLWSVGALILCADPSASRALDVLATVVLARTMCALCAHYARRQARLYKRLAQLAPWTERR